jgi:hypothetical protein
VVRSGRGRETDKEEEEEGDTMLQVQGAGTCEEGLSGTEVEGIKYSSANVATSKSDSNSDGDVLSIAVKRQPT